MNWIEAFLHNAPDNGDGSLEIGIALAIAGAAILFWQRLRRDREQS